MANIPEKLAEISPATKDIFEDIISGFHSLGLLCSEVDTGSLPPGAVQYHRRNYDTAIKYLGELVLPEELDVAYTPSTEIAIYTMRKTPYGFLHKQQSSKFLRAGESVFYRTESRVEQLLRPDDHGKLPKTEDYIAFYTAEHRYLRVSADHVAVDLYTSDDAKLELVSQQAGGV